MLFDNRIGNQDVRGELFEPMPVRGVGESLTEQFNDSDTLSYANAIANSVMAAFRVELIRTRGEFDPGSGRTLAACLTHASHGGGAIRNRRTGA
jgi:hypothetical protein